MEVLWDCPEELCTRDVLAQLTEQTLAYTTVATVLTNLTKKGMVERVVLGRVWAYRPLRSRSEYTAGLMADALSTSDDRAASFLHFVRSIEPGDAALLRQLLAEPDDATGDPPGTTG